MGRFGESRRSSGAFVYRPPLLSLFFPHFSDTDREYDESTDITPAKKSSTCPSCHRLLAQPSSLLAKWSREISMTRSRGEERRGEVQVGIGLVGNFHRGARYVTIVRLSQGVFGRRCDVDPAFLDLLSRWPWITPGFLVSCRARRRTRPSRGRILDPRTCNGHRNPVRSPSPPPKPAECRRNPARVQDGHF